jgi:hypothetical protein
LDRRKLELRAIETRQRLACLHHGSRARIIELQCYGIGKKESRIGVSSPNPRWRYVQTQLFAAEGIENAEVVGTFRDPGPNYKRIDSAMRIILAQL